MQARLEPTRVEPFMEQLSNGSLPADIRLGRKWLTMVKHSRYHDMAIIMAVKKFKAQRPVL